jgi:hypothetical protein
MCSFRRRCPGTEANEKLRSRCSIWIRLRPGRAAEQRIAGAPYEQRPPDRVREAEAAVEAGELGPLTVAPSSTSSRSRSRKARLSAVQPRAPEPLSARRRWLAGHAGARVDVENQGGAGRVAEIDGAIGRRLDRAQRAEGDLRGSKRIVAQPGRCSRSDPSSPPPSPGGRRGRSRPAR